MSGAPASGQIDIEDHRQLLRYLRDAGHVDADQTPRMRNLAGGVSNRTVLVEFDAPSGASSGAPSDPPSRQGWVIKQALAKLRVAVDWFSDPMRIHREAAGLRAVGELAPGAAPGLIFEDREQHIVAMQAVPQPHDNYKSLLLRGMIEPDHTRQFAAMLGRIHRGSTLQRRTLAIEFADRSFFEALRLEPYYYYPTQQEPRTTEFLTRLAADTRALRLALAHGDYSPKNVLIHRGRLVLLDYEVIHFGDPAFDLGFAMTHYLSKAHHLPAHREALTTTANLFWRDYHQALGDVHWRDELEPRAVRHTLGCMMARVCGRSPLEYLTDAERTRQCDAVLAIMTDPPRRIAELVEQFIRII